MNYYLKSISLIFAALLMSCTVQESAQEAPVNAETNAVYYLVRHAEKTTEKDNPGLTEAGYKRAEDLSVRLTDVPLTKIYDPRDLESLATKLLNERGHILVVGHSNTTPPLSKLLGGQAGEPIIEATEYNRLYIITRNGNAVKSVIETFGE